MKHAVIMAGGSGTRFWPRSRESKPKQLLAIDGRESLLRQTFDRLAGIVGPENIWIVTADDLVQKCVEELPRINPDNVIGEPLRRNTAPCVGAAAAAIKRRDAEGVMGVFPADHLISKPDNFSQATKSAFAAAQVEPVIVTLGVEPAGPATGYGYIDFGPKLGDIENQPLHSINGFIEKPDRELAQELIDRGNNYWNAGIFFFGVDTILDAIGLHLPELRKSLEECVGASSDEDFTEAVRRIYPGLDSVSIDVGVMERADNLRGIPVDIGWSDVGAWTALEELLPKDGGNIAVDKLVAIDSSGNIVHAPGKLVVLIGVDDLIVVPTDDAVLVCHKSRAQEIKRIYRELLDRGWDEFL